MLLLFGQGNNSAVKRTPLNITLSRSFFRGYAVPVLINYMASGTDLLISQPAPGQSVYLVGLEGGVTSSVSNPVWKSNSTVLLQYQLSANSGVVEAFSPNDPRIICNTEPGEALYFNSDTLMAPMVAYIIEY